MMTFRPMPNLARCLLPLLLVISGCGRNPDVDYTIIEAWLNCDECLTGEREAVAALGQDAVGLLSTAVLDGPPEDRRRIMREQAIAAYATASIAGLSADQYADGLQANYIANYNKRAAISLGDIKGEQARKTLDEALKPANRSGYRDDALRVISFVRSTFDSQPFQGSVTTPVVNFGDTVELRPPPGQTFTGSDTVAIDDATFPQADIVYFRQPDRIGLAAVGVPGSHAIVVGTPGSPGGVRVALFAITSIADANDRSMMSCLTFACEDSIAPRVVPTDLPYRAFVSLSRSQPRPDTLDAFRFTGTPGPGAFLPLTAELDWGGPANLDLSWRRCASSPMPPGPPSLVVGNMDGSTSGNPERTSVRIPGGECWLLLVGLGAGTTQPVFAQLRVRSP